MLFFEKKACLFLEYFESTRSSAENNRSLSHLFRHGQRIGEKTHTLAIYYAYIMGTVLHIIIFVNKEEHTPYMSLYLRLRFTPYPTNMSHLIIIHLLQISCRLSYLDIYFVTQLLKQTI